MPITNLETKIDAFVINTEARLLAVTRKAISDVAEDMQTPKNKGGKMPVKTGFLRSSGVADLNSAPRGPIRGEKNRTYTWSGQAINAVLARLKLGDAFYFGWTAIYAKRQEVRNAFLESSLQKWQTFVDKAVQHFKDKDMQP